MIQISLNPAILRVKARHHWDEAMRERDPDQRQMHVDAAGEYERLADEVEGPSETRH